MTVGLAATAVAVLLGAALGIVSGYFGHRVDLALQRVVDAWLAFPGLVMVIVLLVLLGPGLGSVILALGISQAFPQSRIIRGATMVVREHAYIEASRASGASHGRVLLRHVLPNVVAPIIVSASTYVSFVILIEAAVSFLGYGVPPPAAFLGRHAQRDGPELHGARAVAVRLSGPGADAGHLRVQRPGRRAPRSSRSPPARRLSRGRPRADRGRGLRAHDEPMRTPRSDTSWTMSATSVATTKAGAIPKRSIEPATTTKKPTKPNRPASRPRSTPMASGPPCARCAKTVRIAA